jgi:hypothetical protein
MNTRLYCLFAVAVLFTCYSRGYSQVDTSYVYNPSAPFGPLDIRIAQSPTRYHYLKEGETFSFRGTRTYYDMTSWDSSPYKEGHLVHRTADGDRFIMNYRLLIPDEYRADFPDGYPLIVVFHGLGERGNCAEYACYHADRTWSPVANNPPAPTSPNSPLMNNDHNLLHGGQVHLSAMKRAEGRLPGDASLNSRAFPGFVLFPQNLNGWDRWSVEDVIRIIRLITKKYNINEDRIYVEGISNGGHGMYQALKRAPWLFAAGIAMSAIDDGAINANGVAESIAHIPLWVFQGGMDENPLPSKTVRYIQQFRAAGASVRYTLYPELGHGTWNKAFNEPEFFSWLLGKQKNNLHTYQSTRFICSNEGTRLEVAAGFPAYQWQYNGSIISGADGPVLMAKDPGEYRVRYARVANPSENQWNSWSQVVTLSATEPPRAVIEQLSTVKLPGLDGGSQARLRSAGDYDQYFWYRNGHPIDLPGNVDDTLRYVTFPSSSGDGQYTLVVTELGCKSDPSSPVSIVYGDRAEINVTAPADFEGISLSPSETVLSWTDQSNNESGFEIWRRKSGENWKWVGITGPNSTSFDDNRVEPNAAYQYKIRAVSNTGRSDYIPSGANGITVETIEDNEEPTVPTSLKIKNTGVGEVTLTWSPATDNTRIREYVIIVGDETIHTNSADTTFVLTDLPINQEYSVSVYAVDLSRNEGGASDPVSVSTYVSGLFYRHTTGSWTSLDSIDWSWAEFTGTIGTFSLAPKTQDDYYNLSFEGFIFIEEEGTYQFRITSSDGTRLWLNDRRIIDNDGIHEEPKTEMSGEIELDRGGHHIYLQYFEDVQTDTLLVEYKGPDTGEEWIPIPRAALKSHEDAITGIGDEGGESAFRVSVYPNPTTHDNVTVQVESVLDAPVRVRVHDTMGRTVLDHTYGIAELSYGIALPQGSITGAGMYIVEVLQGRMRKTERVVIRR